jgi:hypothetical protein
MPGKYVVVETDPSGYSSTATRSDNDNHIVIDLTPAATIPPTTSWTHSSAPSAALSG